MLPLICECTSNTARCTTSLEVTYFSVLIFPQDTYQKVFCILNANTLSFYEKKRTQRELERIKVTYIELSLVTFLTVLKTLKDRNSKLTCMSPLRLAIFSHLDESVKVFQTMLKCQLLSL